MRLGRGVVRMLVVAIVAAFGGSICATCVDASTLGPHAQMACCKDGEMTCASHGTAHDCCVRNATPSRDALISAKVVVGNPLTAVLASPAVTARLMPPTASIGSLHATSPPLASGPPPFIAFSSLLI